MLDMGRSYPLLTDGILVEPEAAYYFWKRVLWQACVLQHQLYHPAVTGVRTPQRRQFYMSVCHHEGTCYQFFSLLQSCYRRPISLLSPFPRWRNSIVQCSTIGDFYRPFSAAMSYYHVLAWPILFL